MSALDTKHFTFILLLYILPEVRSTGNAPNYVIPSGPDTTTISEDADPSTSIYTILASDDEGDTLTYSVYNQTPSSPSFVFNDASLKLYPPASLDAETTTTFTIEFSVTDGTSTVYSPILTIHISDVNEHSPDFNQTSYTASIYDTASNGDVVITVFATDLDVTATLTYSITAGDSTTFSINPSSGAISVATASNLNAASTPTYTLTVQVSDTSNTDTATVTITVIDDPCLPNPCENSGLCSKSGATYTCTCQTGWIGTTCNTDNPCLPNPCENSGNCSVVGTSYQCQCTSDYSGKNCTDENDKDDVDNKDPAVGIIIAVCVVSVASIVVIVSIILYYKKCFLKKKEKDLDLSKINNSRTNSFINKRNSVSPKENILPP